MERFHPAEYVRSVYDIDLQALRQRGVQGIICDLDNTLVAWDSSDTAPELHDWFAKVQRAGLKLCIVSNNGPGRVGEFAKSLGVPFVANAAKPRRKAFRRAMELLGTTPAQTAVVGDQVFTDVFGGNRQGLHTILVVPISRQEFIGTRLVRVLEQFVLRGTPGAALRRQIAK